MCNKENLSTKKQPITPVPTAKSKNIKVCLSCHYLLRKDDEVCDICSAQVSMRIHDSLNKTVACLSAAILLFIPANILPIMSANSVLENQEDTILSGILHLWHTEAYFIAIIVLVASFITPLFKMISISYLCYTCYKRSTKNLIFRTKLYHFNELIGRWSMIDVFVVAVLSALVQIGAFANIEPRLGVIAFALVVFLSIFSMKYFDPRLIWDYVEIEKEETNKVDKTVTRQSKKNDNRL